MAWGPTRQGPSTILTAAIDVTLAPKWCKRSKRLYNPINLFVVGGWSGAAIDVTLAPKWCKRSKSKILVFLNLLL